jgi:osmotically-inducible protein OsmY
MNKPIYDLPDQVQAVFSQDEEMQDSDIEVLDNNGIVTLRGSAPTRAARDKAEAVVRGIQGVVDVINELDVI